MKRQVEWVVLVAGIAFSLACGGGGSSSSTSVPTPTLSPTATPTPTSTPANLPVISSFKVDAPGISLGNKTTLRWEVSNATGLSLDQGIGTLSGQVLTDKAIQINADAAGERFYTLTATNANGSSTARVRMVIWPAAVGINADRPPLLMERNGAFKQAWIGGRYWPEQLFWEDMQFYKTNYPNGILDVQNLEGVGLAPVIDLHSQGVDLLQATGGNAQWADCSHQEGYIQYAAWMNPRVADYFALKSDGSIAYPTQGFISFGMPMKAEDISNGAASQTFGEWAGSKVGSLAKTFGCRGLYTSDFFQGLVVGADWHPRLMDQFQKVTGITVPGATVQARSNYIVQNCYSQWLDFLAAGQASFFATVGQAMLDAGKTPVLSGQVHAQPPIQRLFANDPRVWSKQFPGKFFLFIVENEASYDSKPQDDWMALISVGATASRQPDVPIGAMLDADIFDFWSAAKNAGWDTQTSQRYLKHQWLTAGWALVAASDGSTRRGCQAIMRSFWDGGLADPDTLNTLLTHIPRQPFGPCLYYSVNIEKTFEAPPPPGTDTPNYYYFMEYLQRSIATPLGPAYPKVGLAQGMNIGYFMSDAVDPAKLPAANKPSAWLVYDLDRLPSAERAKLESIAPVLDPALDPLKALQAGPLWVTGSGLNCMAFVDQNGSVIVLVGNRNFADTTGTMEFTNVSDGTFTCNGLLGTPQAKLTVNSGKGSVPISVPARGTLVFEIPNLKWLGR